MLSLLCFVACTSSNDPPGRDDSGTPVPTDDSAPPTKVDPDTVPLAGECPMANDYGGLAVVADGEPASVNGSVANGVVPASVLEELMTDGDCKLLRRNNPYCDPTCAAGEVCDFDGECLPYPANQDLGTIAITGLTVAVSMKPVFPGYTYFVETDLPIDPFIVGGLITLSAPDAPGGAVELHGVGVEALVSSDKIWTFESGNDFVVHWVPPTTEVVRSEVVAQISIDKHGATPSILRCTFEDDGEGTVSGKVLQELVGAGVTGFPNGTLNRRTVDNGRVQESGCMDFAVSSPRRIPVDVVGYTPCITKVDCPKGQTCNKELEICE